MQSIKGKEKRHNELYENNVILQTEQILSIIQETPNSNLQPGVNFLNKENIKNSTHHILIACDHESKPVGMTTLIHANTETGSLKTSNLLEELRLDPSLINSSYWISTAIPNQQHRSQGLGRVLLAESESFLRTQLHPNNESVLLATIAIPDTNKYTQQRKKLDSYLTQSANFSHIPNIEHPTNDIYLKIIQPH